MQENIRCIVLRTVKYGDNSTVVDTFTENYGRMSFMANVSRNRKSGASIAFWSQLSQIEFQADIRPQGKLAKPRDVRFTYSYSTLPYNPLKAGIAMFIGEFLCAALKGENENIPLYKYLETSLRWLDIASTNATGIANFHLVFVMRLTRFLGIYPNLEDRHLPYFDLIAGEYTEKCPMHTHYIKGEEAKVMPLLYKMDFATMRLFLMNRQQRQRVLEVLMEYYRIHMPQFPQLKSLEVLSELFS